LNSKRPDGDSVKETSPLSKFLGICTTIQGHDLFAIPINKTVGAPYLSPSLLPSNLCQSKLPFSTSAPPKTNGRQWQQASCQRRSRRKPRWLPSEVVIVNSLCDFFQDIFFPLLMILYCSRLIHWNPAPAPANPALPDDSSESYNYSPVPYGERDALRFKAERDESRRELGEISKKACIAELEWEDQRKQLLATIDGTSL
jgi:hypothetical protein